MQMLVGGGCLLLVGLLDGEAGRIHLERISMASVLAVGYLTLFGSLVAFTSYLWLLRVAPTPLVSTYAYVNPVVAFLLGWAILSEPFTLGMATAAAIIVAGVAMIMSAETQTRTPARRRVDE